jgi:uncharacterized repeat protein (TIGR03987 family)
MWVASAPRRGILADTPLYGFVPQTRRDIVPGTSMIIITLALLFYTIGIWSARITRQLKWWHVAFFWLGLICDTWGTVLMLGMAGGLSFDLHGLTGLIAILLMLANAIWATVVLLRRDERGIRTFHRFSVWVWAIWLIPYLSPMFFALR